MKSITLTWGTSHSLKVSEYGGMSPCMTATLSLIKPNGTQQITFSPPDLTLESIQKSWEAQGAQWMELVVVKDQPFVAVRGIQLDGGYAILWHVFHLNDAPFDAVSVGKLDLSTVPRIAK